MEELQKELKKEKPNILYCLDILDKSNNKCELFDLLLQKLEIANLLENMSIKYDDEFNKNKIVELLEKSKLNSIITPNIKVVGMYYTKLTNGGTERVIEFLTKIFISMGYKVILITDTPSSEDYILIPENAKRYDLTKSDSYYKRAFEISEIVSKEKIDTIIYHKVASPILILDMILYKSLGVSFIIYFHNVFSVHLIEKSPNFTYLPKIYSVADCIICLGDVNKAYWDNFNSNVFSVYNPPTFEIKSSKVSKLDDNVILWVGRISFEKKPYEALMILAEVCKVVPNTKLKFVGKPIFADYLENLKNFATILGVENNVEFCGFHEDVSPFFLNSSILLSTSMSEGFPMVLFEGKTFGLPIVLYDLPYLTISTKNRGMFPVEFGDHVGAANEIIKLLLDKELCKKAGVESREHAIELSDYDYHLVWFNIFESLAQSRDKVSLNESQIIMWNTLQQHYSLKNIEELHSKKLNEVVKITPLNRIPIIYICEDIYIKQVSVSIISLLQNANYSTNYDIYILHKTDYSEENTKKLLSIEKKYKNCGIFIKQINNMCNNIAILISKNLIDITKCIYLSCDTVIQKDLNTLYDINISDFYVAGVKDDSAINCDVINNNQIDSNVMIFNLNLIRNSNLTDEDFVYDAMPIKLKFNLASKYFDNEKTFNFGSKIKMNPNLTKIFKGADIKEALNDNFIFSYDNKVNPLISTNCSFFNVWLEYFKLSPFFNETDINMPKISVIIPVYNVENYLERCVLSVINQDYTNLEIILIDDGSTDISGELCDNLAKKDKRITVIHKENGGVSSARNIGLKEAKGEYISLLDSDDFIHPQTYSLAIDVFNENNNIDLVEWGANYINESSINYQNYSEIVFDKIIEKELLIQEKIEFIEGTILRSPNSVNQWSKLFKRDFINGIFYNENRFAEDLFFTNEYMEKVNRVAFIKLPLYYYLLRYGSLSHQTLKIEHLDEFIGFTERYQLLKSKYPKLLEIACRKDLAFFYSKLKKISQQRQDDNLIFREKLINIMLEYYYDDIIKFGKIDRWIKDDFILAKKDINSFINKYEYENNEPVIIAFASDENYTPYLGVAIESLIDNCNLTRLYKIYIFNTSITSSSIIKLQSLSTANVEIFCIDVKLQIQKVKELLQLPVNSHFTEEIYYRFLIPEVLSRYKKVLYLDCDIICLKDVGELFDIDVSNNSVGVVFDLSPLDMKEYKTNILKLPIVPYFNSGVMIFNNEMFISLKLQEKCYDFLIFAKENNIELIYSDQDVLNIVTKDTALYIDSRWNAMYSLKKLNGRDLPTLRQYEQIQSAFQEQFIIHFNTHLKPWYQPKVKWSSYFWYYTKKSIFANQVFTNLVNHHMGILINDGQQVEYNNVANEMRKWIDWIIKNEKNNKEFSNQNIKNVSSKLNSPQISVIIPVYNVENHVKNCVLSIVNQTYKNLEIILVDDGSTDMCAEICDELSKSDERIIVIHKENGGVSSARNTGLGKASGKYVSFIDSDDLIHPQTYEIAIGICNDNPDIDLVEWDFVVTFDDLDYKYDIKTFNEIKKYDSVVYSMEEFIRGIISFNPHKVQVWNKLFKKHLISDLKFPNFEFAEDVFFTNEYMFKFKKMGYIQNKLYYYNQRVDSIMNNNIKNSFSSDIDAFYERHLLIKNKFPNLAIHDLDTVINKIYERLRDIVDQNNDLDQSMRIATATKMIEYYFDEVMLSNSVATKIKSDFILAKSDIVAFINKNEEEQDTKSLYVVNTVLQLFNTINYRVNLSDKNERADLILSDHTPVLKEYYETLLETNLFENIYLIDTLKISLLPIQNAENYNILLESTRMLNEICDINIGCYDKLYCSNFDVFDKILFNANTNLSINIIEDGIETYSIDHEDIQQEFKYIPNYLNIFQAIESCYVYNPDLMLYKKNYQIKKLPSIDKKNKQFIELLNKIFVVKQDINLPKFIYIEQYFEDISLKCNDLPILKTISEIVGKENFYIKNHPRTKNDSAKLLGISKDFDYHYPLELILLNINLEEHVFISVNPTTIVSINLIFECDAKIVYLDDLSDLNGFSYKNDTSFIFNYISKSKFKNIMRPYLLDEFKDILLRNSHTIKLCNCEECQSAKYNPADYIITENEFSKLNIDRPIGLSGHLRAKNEALTLSECIESCIEFLDELIITYNDSEDKTEEIILKYANLYPTKIKVFHYKPTIIPHTFFHQNNNMKETLKFATSSNIHNPANYYNFGYTKIRYKYYMKIDADQVYFTEKMLDVRNMLLDGDFKNSNSNLTNYILENKDLHNSLGLTLGGVNLTKNLSELDVSIFDMPFNGCVGDHFISIPISSRRYFYYTKTMQEAIAHETKRFPLGFAWLHFGYAKNTIQGHNVDTNERGVPLEEFIGFSWNKLLSEDDFVSTLKKLPDNYVFQKFGEIWWDYDRKYIYKTLKDIDFDNIQEYFIEKIKIIRKIKR